MLTWHMNVPLEKFWFVFVQTIVEKLSIYFTRGLQFFLNDTLRKRSIFSSPAFLLSCNLSTENSEENTHLPYKLLLLTIFWLFLFHFHYVIKQIVILFPQRQIYNVNPINCITEKCSIFFFIIRWLFILGTINNL
jgi:hypothetical protein